MSDNFNCYQQAPKILSVPGWNRLDVPARPRCEVWAMSALRLMMQTKGIPAGQR